MNIMAKLYKWSGEILEVSPENGKDFSLEELQDFVDGYIEVVSMSDEEYMVVNEEGKLMNLPYNENATRVYNKAFGIPIDYIVGNALVCDKNQIK